MTNTQEQKFECSKKIIVAGAIVKKAEIGRTTFNCIRSKWKYRLSIILFMYILVE